MKKSRQIHEARRDFLRQLGLGGAAAGLFAPHLFYGPALAQPSVTCAPPGPPGTPAVWRADCRPIQSRRPASTLSGPEIQKLRDAYGAMRDLAMTDPNDPRGYNHQANVHCWNCSVAANQQHFSWRFFTWHRAMLYFHERILGKLVGDENLRLPYWDWEVPTHRTMPAAFTNPNDATNPLWNSTRTLSPAGTLSDTAVGDTVMQSVLTLGSFAEFGGTATGSGSPEFQPHGHPHVRVGGDMSTFETAGRDPIFYAHHGNLDKLWSDWTKAASTHTNPTDPAYLGLTFTFYDENRRWTSIKASQVLDHEASLRYRYGASLFLERLPCILQWFPIKTTWATQKKVVLDSRAAVALAVPTKEVRVRLHVSGLELPTTKSAEYHVYASAAEAAADAGPDAEGYLGTVPVVLNSLHHHVAEKRSANLIFDVTRKMTKLIQRQAPLELFLVEADSKQPRAVIPVKARDVSFSKGETK